MPMIKIIRLIRPWHWVKNLFIFLPLFFGQEFTNINKIYTLLIVFLGFSFIASAVYCFNDIIDRETDKLDPRKNKRPVASGEISVRIAFLIMFILLLSGISIFLVFIPEPGPLYLALLYFLTTIIYSLKLKHIAIIDVIIIAIGFVLRVVIGGISADVYLSHWIILITFLLALFLGFAKRRDDVLIYESTGMMPRKNTNSYSLTFVDSALILSSAIMIVSYIMYTVSNEVNDRLDCEYVYITTIFVITGILRYLQKIIVDNSSGDPTRVLLKDTFIQLCILGWILSFVFIIYL